MWWNLLESCCFPTHDQVTPDNSSRVSPTREQSTVILALEDTTIKVWHCSYFYRFPDGSYLGSLSGSLVDGLKSYCIQYHALSGFFYWKHIAAQILRTTTEVWCLNSYQVCHTENSVLCHSWLIYSHFSNKLKYYSLTSAQQVPWDLQRSHSPDP